MKPEANEFEIKEQGNKYFAVYKYDEALQCYSKAILKNPNVASFYANRSLCYIKSCEWTSAAEDAKKALELDPNCVKAHFFLGQALLELNAYDEAIKHIQRAFDISKEKKLNYGDEIAYLLRLSKKKKLNQLEDKRIKEKGDLQSYLIDLINQDKKCKYQMLMEEYSTKNLNDQELQKLQNESINKCDKYLNDLNEMFVQLDVKRKKKDIPDYLCGKISFEIMKDPIITPSGITYDRKDIEEHLQRVGHFDPVTRHPLTADQLIPNLSMKEVIDSFLLENEWANEY